MEGSGAGQVELKRLEVRQPVECIAYSLSGLIIGKTKQNKNQAWRPGPRPAWSVELGLVSKLSPRDDFTPPFRACGGPGRFREGAVSGMMALAVTVPWDPLSSLFLPDCVLRDAPGVQVPRDVGLVHGAHVLDAAAHAARSGRRATRQIRWSLARTLRQPRQQPRLAGRAAAPGARRPRAQAAVPPRPRLL